MYVQYTYQKGHFPTASVLVELLTIMRMCIAQVQFFAHVRL
jgi:hypothetical protein